MDEPKEQAKAAKKAAKARAKALKKLSPTTHDPSPSAAEASALRPTSAERPSTPSERSAAAAERQVRLQMYRVWIAVAVGLVTLMGLFLHLRSRGDAGRANAPSHNASTATNESP